MGVGDSEVVDVVGVVGSVIGVVPLSSVDGVVGEVVGVVDAGVVITGVICIDNN